MVTVQNIDVLREMVRLAEKRREEELRMLERVNQYNLALIAFSGSFLSLLVSVDLSPTVLPVSGIFLVISILFSLCTVRPKKVLGSVSIEEDLEHARTGVMQEYSSFLLSTAEWTHHTAENISKRVNEKKNMTRWAAMSLVVALIAAYSISVMPGPGTFTDGI